MTRHLIIYYVIEDGKVIDTFTYLQISLHLFFVRTYVA